MIEWILIIIVTVLGVAFISQSIAYKSLEEKIISLNKILLARNKQIEYLKNADTEEAIA